MSAKPHKEKRKLIKKRKTSKVWHVLYFYDSNFEYKRPILWNIARFKTTSKNILISGLQRNAKALNDNMLTKKSKTENTCIKNTFTNTNWVFLKNYAFSLSCFSSFQKTVSLNSLMKRVLSCNTTHRNKLICQWTYIKTNLYL